MLYALKEMYKFSICFIKFQRDLSSIIRMERGVRQGPASSVLLFNCFMDGLFQHLEESCSREDLLNDIHTLIHADDTIILSTNRNKCIHTLIHADDTIILSTNRNKFIHTLIHADDTIILSTNRNKCIHTLIHADDTIILSTNRNKCIHTLIHADDTIILSTNRNKFIHTLIHVDDTIILSTNRNKLIHKCNELVTFLDENHLNLNIGKSGYLIINPKTCDIKSNIILNSGVLKYNASFEYLGVFVSDTGSLKQDVKKYIGHKRSNVSIKYTNFCKTNKNAPLYAKLEVLDKCVTSAIIYGCETWGKCTSDVELCYRSGLKTALNVRQNLNNEIYFETGKWPLLGRIKRAQLKFWLHINEYTLKYPDSAISKILPLGINDNINYLNYYNSLQAEFSDPISCQNSIEKMYFDKFSDKIISDHNNDIDSRLGTYYRINTQLKKYVPCPQTILEFERTIVTRYRTGSHCLAIEIGRMSNINRNDRVCACGVDVQTICHITTQYVYVYVLYVIVCLCVCIICNCMFMCMYLIV